MAFVISFKDILLRNESEDRDGFIENSRNFSISFLVISHVSISLIVSDRFTYAFEVFLQMIINEQRQEL